MLDDMREMLYVSRRKLLQFQEVYSRPVWWRRVTKFGLKAPLSLGEVSLELNGPGGPRIPSLDSVIQQISLNAAWYQDQSALDPGQWVQFEARMNYATTSLKDGQIEPGDDGPLVFWEPEDRDLRRDGKRSIRLLLHATADGLVGAHDAHRRRRVQKLSNAWFTPSTDSFPRWPLLGPPVLRK
jgi:hypothetical protein